MATRSARLARGLSGGADVTIVVYECPTGVTTIVKDIRLAKEAVGTAHIAIGMRSGSAITWLMNGDVAGPLTVAMDTWVILEPGDELILNNAVANSWNYWISGSRLAGVAP